VSLKSRPAEFSLPGKFMVLISVRDWVEPKATGLLEVFNDLKNNDLIGN
jgi:hypothetical protein